MLKEDERTFINFIQIFTTLLVIFIGLEYWGASADISFASIVPGFFIGYMLFRYFEWLFDESLKKDLFIPNFIAFLFQWVITILVVIDAWILTGNIWVLFAFNMVFIYWVVLIVYWIVKTYRCEEAQLG